MDTLSTVRHESKFSYGSYQTFAVNGVAIEVWLAAQSPAADLNLVSAHDGLHSDQETRLVWDRIYSTAPSWCCIVPLLVCPDDLDLTCSVIVAEQVSTEKSIVWERFGLLRESAKLTSPSVDWFSGIRSVTFDRENFMTTLDSSRASVNVELDWD